MYLDNILLSGILGAWHWLRSKERDINVTVASMSGSRERAQSANLGSAPRARVRTGISHVNTSSRRDRPFFHKFGEEGGIRTLGSGVSGKGEARSTALQAVAINRSATSSLKGAGGEDVLKRLTLHLHCKSPFRIEFCKSFRFILLFRFVNQSANGILQRGFRWWCCHQCPYCSCKSAVLKYQRRQRRVGAFDAIGLSAFGCITLVNLVLRFQPLQRVVGMDQRHLGIVFRRFLQKHVPNLYGSERAEWIRFENVSHPIGKTCLHLGGHGWRLNDEFFLCCKGLNGFNGLHEAGNLFPDSSMFSDHMFNVLPQRA